MGLNVFFRLLLFYVCFFVSSGCLSVFGDVCDCLAVRVCLCVFECLSVCVCLCVSACVCMCLCVFVRV